MFAQLIGKNILIDKNQIEENLEYQRNSPLTFQTTKYRGNDIVRFIDTQLRHISTNYRRIVASQRANLAFSRDHNTGKNKADGIFQELVEIKHAFKKFNFDGKELSIVETRVFGVQPFIANPIRHHSNVSIFHFERI